MGCASSSDAHDDRRQSTGAADRYAESASPIASEAEVLHAEIDRRSASHYSSADEPSSTMLSIRIKAIVTRGSIQNDINADPDQFAATVELPEFKKRDRRRVEEWTKGVGAGPFAPVPADDFYLPDDNMDLLQMPHQPSHLTVSSDLSKVSSTVGSSFGRADTESSDFSIAMVNKRSSGGTATSEHIDVDTSTESRRINSSNFESFDRSETSARAGLARQGRSPEPMLVESHDARPNESIQPTLVITA